MRKMGWRIINLYQFCGNDPVNRVDAYGLDVCAVLDRSSGTLTVTDNQTGKTTTAPLFPRSSTPTIGDHEQQHTYQGELLGPLYLPAYIGGMIGAGIQGKNPFGPGHFMEAGPYTRPTPQIWR